MKYVVTIPEIVLLVVTIVTLTLFVSIYPIKVLWKPVFASPDTITLRPNAAGTYQQWSLVDTTHWGATSDQNDNTYVYVSGSTTLKETENLADTTQTGTISSVTAYMRAKAFDSQTITNSPSSTTGGWTNPTNAYADGGTYAYITSATPSASQTYSGYGFNIPSGASITQVRVRYDAWSIGTAGLTSSKNPTANTGGTNPWTNPTYAYTSDNNRATAVATIPTWRATGTMNHGTTSAITVALPSGMSANDIVILVASTIAGGSITITSDGSVTPWTAVSGSPIDVTGGEKLYVWWGRFSSGSTGVTITPGGDHIVGRCVAYYNCYAGGSPIDVSATGTETASDNSFSFATGLTTTYNNEMVITVCSTGNDPSFDSTAQFSSWTGANLGTKTERMDNDVNEGGGGGFGLMDAPLVANGAVGTVGATLAAVSPKSYIAFALRSTVPNNTFDQIYGTFGITGSGTITKVEIGYEAYSSVAQKLDLYTSSNGGSTWNAIHTTANLGTSDPNAYTYIDVTSDTTWTWTLLNDANFKYKVVTHWLSGTPTWYVDALVVRITYTGVNDEQIRVDVSWDGGTSWSSKQTTGLGGTETTYWYDVTGATWTPEKLANGQLQVRVDAYTVGDTGEVRLDWIPVEVTYQTGFAVILWCTYSTDYESSAITISRTAFTDYSQARTTNPNSGQAWTWTEVNALEIGSRASSLASGETIQVSEYWIVVEYTPDTQAPTYSNTGTNTTLVGQPCEFHALWNDNINVSGFIFGTNNTGTWINDTWVVFSVFFNSTASWSNVTKTLNSTVIVVQWCVWANDTSNNWNNTGIQSFTTVVGYSLNLRVMDWDLVDNIQGACVYKNSDVLVSDINGWANWTLQTGTVQIKVSYYGFWVNGTFSVTMDSDKTINVQCKLYDVTVLVQESVQNAYLAGANVAVYNSTSVQGNKITSGVTGNNGQVQLLNLPNNNLTFTQYGGASYSLVIGNTTQLVSSENQTITLTADQNNVNTNNNYSIIAFAGMTIPFKSSFVTKRLKKKMQKRSETNEGSPEEVLS